MSNYVGPHTRHLCFSFLTLLWCVCIPLRGNIVLFENPFKKWMKPSKEIHAQSPRRKMHRSVFNKLSSGIKDTGFDNRHYLFEDVSSLQSAPVSYPEQKH